MHKTTKETASIGYALKTARDIKKWSLRKVANDADITPTYLKKLEDDDVKEPSPNILYRLSNALTIPYADLMRLVGYVVPNDKSDASLSSDPLAVALRSADLSEDELKHMMEYLAFTKNKK